MNTFDKKLALAMTDKAISAILTAKDNIFELSKLIGENENINNVDLLEEAENTLYEFHNLIYNSIYNN